jgi:hypothetical protein
MDHEDAVRGEVDVELESISAGGKPGVERRYRVLGSERAPATMREDEWSRGSEEGQLRSEP